MDNTRNGSKLYLYGIVSAAVLGKDFEEGKLTFERIYEYGKKVGEPRMTSGKQEKYEALVALYAK